MAQKVIVTIPKNEDGTPKHELIRVSTNNPEWGSVNVTTTQVSIENGILNSRKRSAYFRGELKHLQMLDLAEGVDLNAKLAEVGAPAMRIKRTESFTPAYEGHQQKMNPQTGEKIFVDGQPIYLQDTVALATEEDQLIKSSAEAVVTAPIAVQEAGALS